MTFSNSVHFLFSDSGTAEVGLAWPRQRWNDRGPEGGEEGPQFWTFMYHLASFTNPLAAGTFQMRRQPVYVSSWCVQCFQMFYIVFDQAPSQPGDAPMSDVSQSKQMSAKDDSAKDAWSSKSTRGTPGQVSQLSDHEIQNCGLLYSVKCFWTLYYKVQFKIVSYSGLLTAWWEDSGKEGRGDGDRHGQREAWRLHQQRHSQLNQSMDISVI